MNNFGYGPPVNQLLTYGDCRKMTRDWPDYLALGLGPEHIPDLIRMATDKRLHTLSWDEENPPLPLWAPVHAWRALGQLQAEAAAEPLVTLLERVDKENDEWIAEELPMVFGMIGPKAIPTLATYLNKQAHGLYARIAASTGLKEIAQRHPAARDECVAVLSAELARFKRNNRELNGFLIGDLMNLKATEALPVIEQAFAAKRVDTFIVGDWDDVQVAFGLKERPPAPPSPPKPLSEEERFQQLLRSVGAIAERIERAQHKQAKKKRKQAAQARKRNRKRK